MYLSIAWVMCASYCPGKQKAHVIYLYHSVAIFLVPLGLFLRSWLARRKLARTGIGRGAPGFQTSVRQISVTPEIAARLRRGEHVSPEEIAAAQAPAAMADASTNLSDAGNEWLPEDLKRSSNNRDIRSRGKKRR